MADPSWTSADVAKALCDALVASGKLRANPGFIREDREAKIATVFEYARLPLMHRAPAPPPPPGPRARPCFEYPPPGPSLAELRCGFSHPGAWPAGAWTHGRSSMTGSL